MRALRKRFPSPEGGRRSGSSESVRRCDGPQVLGRPQCNGSWNTSGGTDPPELQRRSDSTSKVVRFWSSSPGDVLATPQRPDAPLVLVPYPEAWRSDDALASAGAFIRGLHEAARGFHTEFSGMASLRSGDEAGRDHL